MTVLGAAFACRIFVVAYCLVHFAPAWYFGRGQEMGLLAASLLHGQGLSSPFGPPTGPTAMIAPAYPILVAGVFAVCGPYARASAGVLMGLNIALNLLTCALVLRLARRWASERAAVLAALIWACSPPLWWLPTICWETSFSCFFLLAAMNLALEQRRASPWLPAFAGVSAALAGLVNPALLPSMAVLAVVAGISAEKLSWKAVAFACAAFLIAFSPWPIRNMRRFHTPHPDPKYGGL